MDQQTTGSVDQETCGLVALVTNGTVDQRTKERSRNQLIPPQKTVFKFLTVSGVTHHAVHSEGGPQRHAGLLAVPTDEGLLVQNTVALVDLQHPGPTQGGMFLLHLLHWKKGEVR